LKKNTKEGKKFLNEYLSAASREKKEVKFVILDLAGIKMVRSLSQWTKTLSFPNRHSKECNVNVHPIQAPPTPARNKTSSSSRSSSPPSSPSNVPITEISQIVSAAFCFLSHRTEAT
jgi:hypothetical protein